MNEQKLGSDKPQQRSRLNSTALLPAYKSRMLAIIVLFVVACAGAWITFGGRNSASEAGKAALVVPGGDATADTVVRLDSMAVRLAGIKVVTVLAGSNATLVANGTITYDANRVAVVSSRTEARVIAVHADLGQRIPVGGSLATLQSSEVGQTRGELERASAAVDVARRNFEREKRLFEEEISPEKEMLDAEGEYRTAQADLNGATSRLLAIGALKGKGATFALATPVAGTIVERNVNPGQVVGPATNLFTVADLSHVWITVDVYEGDLSRVHNGAKVTITPTALPGRTFVGSVTYAGGIIDSVSHTFKVRVAVANEERLLRPGMFAQVGIETSPSRVFTSPRRSAASADELITVPEIAIQQLRGRTVIFVAGRTVGEFVARSVALGPRVGDGSVVIASGLAGGERVAVQGAFQLNAELTKASLGEGGQ